MSKIFLLSQQSSDSSANKIKKKNFYLSIRSFAHKDQVIDVMGEENESALYIYNQLSLISTHQLWTLESI